MGSALIGKFKFEEAIDNLNKALEYDLKDPEALATIYSNIAIAKGGLSDFDEELLYSEKALEFDSECYEAYLSKSNALLNLLKYDEALECCNKAIEKNLVDYGIYSVRGQVVEKKGMLEEAIKAFDKSLEIKPDNEEVKTHRSRVSGKIAIKKFTIVVGVFLVVSVIAIIITVIVVKNRKRPMPNEDLYSGLM
jgi:superkiller protein 3